MRGIGRGVAALVAAALVTAPAGAKRIKEGDPAPDFKVTTLRKEKIDLASLKGKVTVVNLWATWCGPCREEFAMFDWYTRQRGKYGFSVIAIEEGGAETSGPMRKLAEIVSFPVVLASRAHASAYATIDNAVPTNYVIDRAGVIRFAKAGAFSVKELDQVIKPLLEEPAPAAATP